MTLEGGVLTERKTPGPWDDCTLCSTGMLGQFMTGVRILRWQLRAASGVYDQAGVSDPTNLNHGERALRKLYGDLEIVRRPRLSWTEFVYMLRHGYGAVAQGSNARLSTRLRRWDPDYTGGHAMFLLGGAEATVRVMDPLAPEGFEGDVVEWDVIERWMLNDRGNVGPFAMLGKEAMRMIPVTDQTPGRGMLLEGCQVYGPDMKPVRKIGEGGGRVRSPFGGAGYRAIYHNLGGQLQLGFVRVQDIKEFAVETGDDDRLRAVIKAILPHAEAITKLAKG